MKTYLEKLIDNAPEENDGAVQAQILIGGQMLVGAFKRAEVPGMFEMMMVGMDQNRNPHTAKMVFDASWVQGIILPEEQSEIQTPKKNIIIPGMH